MSDWERLGETIEEVNQLLEDPSLEPDPGRSDWANVASLLEQISGKVERDILPGIEAALVEARADGPEAEQGFRGYVVAVLGEVAILFQAARTRDATALLRRAADLAPQGEAGHEIQAANGDLGSYARLVRARWLARHGLGKAANKIFKQIVKETRNPVFARLAKSGLAAPRPIKSAPPLYTLNGCGVGIYGSRDAHPDGTYVTTYFFLLVFLPVFPITAYRVAQEGDKYVFFYKVPLGWLARAYRGLVLGALVLAIGAGAIGGYLNSPSRQATLMLKDARALEGQGKHEQAIKKYEHLVETYGFLQTDAIDDAKQALFTAYVAEVPEPFSEAHMKAAMRAASRVKNLTHGTPDETSMRMIQKLASWAETIKAATPTSMRAAQRLLDRAVEMSKGRPSPELKQKQKELALGLASVIAKERPVAALRIYVQHASDPDALIAASRVVRELGESPSLWGENRTMIELYTRAASSHPQHADSVAFARKKLAEASLLADDDERKQLLAEPAERTLRRWLTGHPLDQHAAAALGELLRNQGNTRQAFDIIAAQGAVGLLIPKAQSLLAYLYFDQGKLELADDVLTPLLAARLPLYQETARKFEAGADRLQASLLASVRQRRLPSGVQSQIDSATTDQEANRIFSEHVEEKIRGDVGLAALREEYEQLSSVVPDVLTLGMIKLQRASVVDGQARQKLLDAAEENLLSIRADAEGMPQYHMSLGQVYHRLGKVDEGERELNGVLEKKQPELSLQVASAYRDLGLDDRATSVATSVYENGTLAEKQSAAEVLALLASDIEQLELWLGRANPAQAHVQTQLASVRAMRAFREGRFEEAERGYADVVARYQKNIKTNPSAANNAALANQSRYLSSANPAHLEAARQGLERALRLNPDSSIIMGNLADAYLYMGMLDILAKHVRVHTLRLNSAQAFGLVYHLADGPMREQLLEQAGSDPLVRKAIDLTGREIVLAPNGLGSRVRYFQMHVLHRDVAALQAWLDAAGEQKIDRSRLEHARKKALTASARKIKEQQVASAVQLAERALADATKLKHRETLALAHYILADALLTQCEVTSEVASAERAVTLHETAATLWPALRADRRVVWAQVRLALVSAGATSPKLAALLSSDGQLLSDGILLHHIGKQPEGQELVAKLRAQPAMKRAISLLRGPAGDSPSLGQWIVASMFGDSALQKATATTFQQEHLRLIAQAEATLDPGAQGTALRWALWQEHKPE